MSDMIELATGAEARSEEGREWRRSWPGKALPQTRPGVGEEKRAWGQYWENRTADSGDWGRWQREKGVGVRKSLSFWLEQRGE